MQPKAIKVLLASTAAYSLLVLPSMLSAAELNIDDCVKTELMVECTSICSSLPMHEAIHMLCRRRCLDCICLKGDYTIKGPHKPQECDDNDTGLTMKPITMPLIDYE
ncbi:hypothetical protein Trydic_g13532 [Trypoxylus dichotomus]